jgi:hypothetical protein
MCMNTPGGMVTRNRHAAQAVPCDHFHPAAEQCRGLTPEKSRGGIFLTPRQHESGSLDPDWMAGYLSRGPQHLRGRACS